MLPVLFKIVGADGGVGPDVAIAGDFAGVVKIVEHAELQGQLMQVGRDVFAEHGQAGVAVADALAVLLQVAEDLIVGAVFLDDVDDVLDAVVRAVGEVDLLRRGLHSIRRQHRSAVDCRRFLSISPASIACQRAVQQRSDVGVIGVFVVGRHVRRLPLRHVVGAGSLPFVGGHVELAIARTPWRSASTPWAQSRRAPTPV